MGLLASANVGLPRTTDLASYRMVSFTKTVMSRRTALRKSALNRSAFRKSAVSFAKVMASRSAV